jgi:hypothetical protein
MKCTTSWWPEIRRSWHADVLRQDENKKGGKTSKHNYIHCALYCLG